MKKIYLDSNENLYNPYKDLKHDFVNDFLNLETFKYPDNIYLELRKAYAKYANVTEENIIAGNGSDDMISLIISTYINKGDKLVTFGPDFSMYDYYIEKNEGVICKYPINGEVLNTNSFIEYIKIQKPKLVMFSNPNNPTGMAVSSGEIEKILLACKGIKIIVDEAYYEFFGDSVVDRINKFNNLIVTRTLSKAFGLASLRVGFLIANKKEVNYLLDNKVPYNVNTLSQVLATRVLKNPKYMRQSVKDIVRGREELFKGLKELNLKNIHFVCSKANYIYAYGKLTSEIVDLLEKNNIIIRKFNDSKIRITVGRMQENNLILSILKKGLVDEKSTD